MFWGLIMEPNKRYTQVVEKPFHISQAAMDISTGDGEPCQVMVVVDGKNFLVCTLQKKQTIQVPLDLYFKTGDSVSFLTNGKCNVHLTGYLDPEFEDGMSDEEEGEEDEDEAPELVPAKNKRKLENSNDVSANKKAKHDKKAAKKAEAEDSDDSDDDDEDQLQKFLDGEDVDTDENDDSFKVNTSAEGDDSDEDDSEEEESGEEEEEEDGEEAEDDSEAGDTTLDTSKDSQPDMSKLTKSQKKRLQKKLKQQAKQGQVNGVDKAKKPEPKQKEAKKEKAAEAPAAAADKKEKKSLSGGVSIEDLKVGNGPVAKPGKVLQVYYEGRLKSNNKKFDDCLKGPGFKFRLGSKEVITGWDVGFAGMKVGGKRRIICPPAMAYGAKGSPPVIPPNSTLVFEVELKNVK